MARVKVQYDTKADRESILQEYKEMYLIEEYVLFEGNFLVFSDKKPVNIVIEELKLKTDMQDTVIEELMFNIIPELSGGGI